MVDEEDEDDEDEEEDEVASGGVVGRDSDDDVSVMSRPFITSSGAGTGGP